MNTAITRFSTPLLHCSRGGGDTHIPSQRKFHKVCIPPLQQSAIRRFSMSDGKIAILTGTTYDGVAIVGSDEIRILPNNIIRQLR